MKNFLVHLWKEDEGQDLIEYALLIVLIVLASIAALGGLTNAIANIFGHAATNLNTAGAPSS